MPGHPLSPLPAVDPRAMVSLARHSSRPNWLPVAIAFLLPLSIALLLATETRATETRAFDFPRGPVRIVVYTGPGGLLDTTARRFAEIARRRTGATFIVENRTGAGGLVAMDSVLHAAADGHTLLACTKSAIAKLSMAARDDLLSAFEWRACLLAESECVIVRADSPFPTLAALVEDARQRPGRQVWLGPASGGLDHILAARLWKSFNITGRWIPYSSGNEAMTALLGGQGQAYVGNPSDALENPLLRILAIAHPSRLPQFADVPVMGECGAADLSDLAMWRGFAFRKGTSAEILAWYDQLFRDVTNDPEWREPWEGEGVQVAYRGAEEFAALVARDADEFREFQSSLGLSAGSAHASPAARATAIFLSLVTLASAMAAWLQTRQAVGLRALLLPLVLQVAALALFWLTLAFPTPDEAIGPAILPRFWLALLILVLPLLLRPRAASAARVAEDDQVFDANQASRGARRGFLVGMFAYGTLLPVIGYYPATIAWLLGGARLLGYRRFLVLAAVCIAWLLIAWLGFEKLLHVELPRGWWPTGMWLPWAVRGAIDMVAAVATLEAPGWNR